MHKDTDLKKIAWHACHFIAVNEIHDDSWIKSNQNDNIEFVALNCRFCFVELGHVYGEGVFNHSSLLHSDTKYMVFATRIMVVKRNGKTYMQMQGCRVLDVEKNQTLLESAEFNMLKGEQIQLP